MYSRRSVRFSSKSRAISRYFSGSWWRKPRSSSCHLSCHTPKRLASGAKISRVSLATARFSGLSGTLLKNWRVRVRIASLIRTTRMSVTIANSILRMVSACWPRSSGVARLSTRANWVSFCTSSTPLTSSQTVLLQRSVTNSCQVGTYLPMSDKIVAATASGKRSSSLTICIDPRKCSINGSP